MNTTTERTEIMNSTRALDELDKVRVDWNFQQTLGEGTSEQIAARRVISVVPAYALGSVIHPTTVEQVIETVATLGDALIDALNTIERLNNEASTTRRDIEGMRRLLGL
jgi:hypothetical protein